MSAKRATGVTPLTLVLTLGGLGAPALAQDAGAEAAPGAGATTPSGDSSPPPTTTQIVITPPQTTVTNEVIPPYGMPAPGTQLDGNLPSSSRAYAPGETDSFDLNVSGAGSNVVSGSSEAIMPTGDPKVLVPHLHVVRRGDTLWDLSGHYFHNPWNWPQVWSYNPQIKDPHWIYPGDQVRLRPGGPRKSALHDLLASDDNSAGEGGLVGRRPLVPPGTVFLRDQGYIGDPERDVWGELVGAREEQMLLSDGNQVYLMFRPGVDLRLGQKLTLFRTVRQPEFVRGARRPPGEIVKIVGTVEIDHVQAQERIARGRIVESLEAIERGAKVGPVGRRFDVVPPKKNEKQVWARVLTSLLPLVYMGQGQVVFIDRGSEDGLAPGNRLKVLRRGDTWRRQLKSASRMARERVRMDTQKRVDIETTPLRGDDEKFPQEVIGELRVLRTEKQSSIALVTSSRRELVAGDRALAPLGY